MDVEKASGAVHLAKADQNPDVSVFGRYSYQDNVPFLAINFGTFRVQLTYDLFDGGRRRAVVRESDTQLAQAKENLAPVTEELRVQTAYNKLELTEQTAQVSKQVLALRGESTRLSAQQLQQGMALKSEANGAAARELEAKTSLLRSQLDYVAAGDELIQAMGQTPQEIMGRVRAAGDLHRDRTRHSVGRRILESASGVDVILVQPVCATPTLRVSKSRV